MKGATIAVCVLATAASTTASPFRAGRALTAMDCDKDCSDLSTASTVLCEMGKYGSCAVTKVAQGGSYVVRGVSGWFLSSDSDSGSDADDQGKATPTAASNAGSTTGSQGSFHGSATGSQGPFHDSITAPPSSATGSQASATGSNGSATDAPQ
ncbi:hypothetical protein SPRG_02309 [Saprolegnia parasitica CBS 223.65]|uniref:Uncharacterized protein n=1 Tax=Saprolegnia parasitica (strain CBS 223.65) TaxID=695850 RepID=A0A067D429_SAPPC|nr:hypothetical protein SPRG_02309 [Saprolegnia parasitica CBS 223.65]KDO33501.1 hypothetical protein SPRG_02309 [Saprolegnia parasitica CBS 223.65]|eukprot:XP_012196244.1 hypothetical protein SPRG_02309 [Saprolegnia parasitica CBS 223.65]